MRIVSGLLLAIGLSAPAMAADMRMPVKAPPVAVMAVSTWAGPYIGVNIGYGWGRADATLSVVGGAFAGASTAAGSAELNGVIGGGQIGYNWQAGAIVFGVEADIQASGQSSTATFACGAACTVTNSARINWFGTARGRVGFVAANSWLLYVTGGAAWTNASQTLTGTTGAGTVTILSLGDTRAGWTLGAGIEGALTRNWSWKLEYLHIRTEGWGGTVAAIAAPFGGAVTESATIANNIVRVGANYRF